MLLLLACTPWSWNTQGESYVNALWDPAVVAAKDGVYVRLPHAGALVRVTDDGTWSTVDLQGATPDALLLAPDGDSLLVWSSWPVCADDDPKVDRVSECDEDDLSTSYELSVVRDGAVAGTFADVPPEFNEVAFNTDGTLAAAYLDFTDTSSLEVDLLLNLTQVSFFDLGANPEVHNVTVGFAAESVLFTAGTPRAVVLSRNQVAVVDLTTWAVTVTYPLTLDADAAVVPNDVVLTPDGRYALVSVDNRSDVYVLDLEQESIDLVELDAAPADLYVDAANDRTLLVYANRAQVDVLEHETFEIETFELEEPANAMMSAGDDTLLYHRGGYHDVYLFDVANADIVEFRAENPVLEMFVTANQKYAVATLDRESTGAGGVTGLYDQYYGLDVFPLQSDGHSTALALESRPVGLALAEQNGEDHALVLLDGIDTVLRIDLFDATNAPVDLSAPPLDLTVDPNGVFVIAQDATDGMLAFLSPDAEAPVEVAGFAATGLFHDDTLPRREE